MLPLWRVVLGLIAAGPGLLLADSPAAAQVAAPDEGVFRIFIEGREVGTETFSIRQRGTGPAAVTVAEGRVVLSSPDAASEVRSLVEHALTGQSRLRYQVDILGEDRTSIRGRLMGQRFSAQVASPSGEMLREHLVSERAVLADRGLAHHYAFLAPFVEAGDSLVPVIVPQAGGQFIMTLADAGYEELVFNGERIRARKISVRSEAEPSASLIWLDTEGRVLRVEQPADGYIALRRGPPR